MRNKIRGFILLVVIMVLAMAYKVFTFDESTTYLDITKGNSALSEIFKSKK